MDLVFQRKTMNAADTNHPAGLRILFDLRTDVGPRVEIHVTQHRIAQRSNRVRRGGFIQFLIFKHADNEFFQGYRCQFALIYIRHWLTVLFADGGHLHRAAADIPDQQILIVDGVVMQRRLRRQETQLRLLLLRNHTKLDLCLLVETVNNLLTVSR